MKKDTAKKTAKVTKTVEAKNAAQAWNEVKQAYRFWKKIDKSGYEAQGHGTIANLRGCAFQVLDSSVTGQEVVLTLETEQGYGYIVGKIVSTSAKETIIEAGKMRWKIAASKVVSTFKTYAAFVAYVASKGEKGIIDGAMTLSNGNQYELFVKDGGKQVGRRERSDTGSGRSKDFTLSGKETKKLLK